MVSTLYFPSALGCHSLGADGVVIMRVVYSHIDSISFLRMLFWNMQTLNMVPDSGDMANHQGLKWWVETSLSFAVSLKRKPRWVI